MISELVKNIEELLLERIKSRYQVDYDRLALTTPPRIELGELALPVAFDLARKVKRPPRDIAQELALDAARLPGIWKVDVAGGGYLNFHLDRASFALRLVESIQHKLYGRVPGPDGVGKIIVEHTNINPNKAAHIGHLRNAALGDSLVRCLRFLGHTVEAQNYLDNTGVQVADVVVGLQRIEGLSLEKVEWIKVFEALGGKSKFDYYCWDVYARVSGFYEKSEQNKKFRSLTLQAIEQGNNPTAELAEYVAMRVVRAHLATMARINVEYDLLPRESEILHLHFWERAFQLLKERGAIYYVNEGKNRGCWVMSTADRTEAPPESSREALEEEEKIIVRSDNTVTYVGKDIAYQLWKFGLLGLDFHYRVFQTDDGHTLWVTALSAEPGRQPPQFGRGRRVYNVIDSRQAYLQGIVLQGLKALGYEQESSNSIHFSYDMVALSPSCCEEMGYKLSEEDKERPYIEVSGRKGLGVKADDLLDALLEKALAEVRSRHSLPEEEAAGIARLIAVSALRYFMLRFARNTVIAFDFKEALSFEGETGPYVQYAVVRANNIFRKLAETGSGAAPAISEADRSAFGVFLANNDDIWDLVYQAARLTEVVRQAVQTLELAQLSKYAFALAQKFNLFYHRHHILSEPDSQRQKHLLIVVDLVRRQLEKALDLLGCQIPPKM